MRFIFGITLSLMLALIALLGVSVALITKEERVDDLEKEIITIREKNYIIVK